MKPRKAFEFIHSRSNDADQFNPLHCVVEYGDACDGIRIAIAEMRERAVEAFCSACYDNKDGECHAFVVGYETNDDRLHEKCGNVRHTKVCKAKIDYFLKKLDGDE